MDLNVDVVLLCTMLLFWPSPQGQVGIRWSRPKCRRRPQVQHARF